MLSDLLHAKVVGVPLVCYIPNDYLQNCVFLHLVLLLLHRIGNFLAYVAGVIGDYFLGILSILG